MLCFAFAVEADTESKPEGKQRLQGLFDSEASSDKPAAAAAPAPAAAPTFSFGALSTGLGAKGSLFTPMAVTLNKPAAAAPAVNSTPQAASRKRKASPDKEVGRAVV